MAFMTANDVKFADPLKDPLSRIGAKSQGNLEAQLGRIASRNRQGQTVNGRPVGEYTGATLDQAGSMAGRGIEDALYGSIGNASYQDALNAQEHERQLALAKRIGAAYKPSTAQEVLGGIGLAGQVAGPLMSAGKSLYQPKALSPGYGSSLNLYEPIDLTSALGRVRR